MAKRGQLTAEIQAKAVAFWGREINQTELRLYPYIHSCAVNDRKIDPRKINSEERMLMQMWKRSGHFEGGMTDIDMSREFFDFINDLLWFAYFTYDSEDVE